MKFKTLDDFNFEGKLVLLRSDLNSDVINKKVILSDRIKESSKTIKELKKKKAKIIIISHQGRPKSKDLTSLSQHSKLLSKYVKIKFVKDVIGNKSSKEIKNLKPGEAILLENIRSLKEEFSPKKNKLVNFFLKLGVEIYVNDAFSVSHRNQTSITELPKHIKKKAIGRLMQKELESIGKLDLKNCLYILGGAKPKDNLKLLKNKKIIATGFFDHLALIAKSYEIGKQEKIIKENLNLVPKIKKEIKKIKTSTDFVSEKRIVELHDLPINEKLLDIGPKTTESIINEIKKSDSIFMKGPIGFFQNKKFAKGTVKVLKALANHKGKVILGGGHLNNVLQNYKINKNSFEHVSLAGGALISYLAKEKLPGLEALK